MPGGVAGDLLAELVYQTLERPQSQLADMGVRRGVALYRFHSSSSCRSFFRVTASSWSFWMLIVRHSIIPLGDFRRPAAKNCSTRKASLHSGVSRSAAGSFSSAASF